MTERVFQARPQAPRWTHVALRVRNIDTTITWYEQFTTLTLLDRRSDEFGHGAWLGHHDLDPGSPFVLVLVQFFAHCDPFRDTPTAALTPFAHLGIELPERADVDSVANAARAAGCLAAEPVQLPPPVGYVCMLHDPDGNLVEFSFDQGVFAAVQARHASHLATETATSE